MIPDGWFVEGDPVNGEEKGEPATFTCIEIEDRHPLSQRNYGAIANWRTRSISTDTTCGSWFSTDTATTSANLT